MQMFFIYSAAKQVHKQLQKLNNKHSWEASARRNLKVFHPILKTY